MRRMVWALRVLVLLAGCVLYRVQTGCDRSMNFRKYRSFTWVRGIRRRSGDPFRFREGSLNEQWVLNVIRTVLSGKGQVCMSPERADLLVNYRVVFRVGAPAGNRIREAVAVILSAFPPASLRD